jgi:hypothetical protein
MAATSGILTTHAGTSSALLRGRRACTLRGAGGQWRLIVTVAIAMIAVYVVLYGLTT